MTSHWKRMLDQLTAGLSEEARQLLHDLGQRHSCFPPMALAKFATKKQGAMGPHHFVLRVRATKFRWRHDGVLAVLQRAILEANGLPIAVIKLSMSKSHKKGRNFEGSRKLRLHFDHGSAVKGHNGVSAALSKSEGQ